LKDGRKVDAMTLVGRLFHAHASHTKWSIANVLQ